ncbi:MAG: alanine--tRNA ligase [Bdellovibrionota bacterium]
MDIRKQFLDYFESKQHLQLPSSSLIPQGDATLLFANAGMNQFKEVFAGGEVPPSPKVVTVQKCVRAGGKHNDLENVGRTGRHHTFFEMLGNFSFGDYFKREAITLAWEFVTKNLQLPLDKLYVTVHHSDDEAFAIWEKEMGLDPKRIYRFGDKDNFWSMGPTGPCGPCSEIFFDQGPNVGCRRPDCKVGCECDRFIEFWNMVFMQFLTLADGTRQSLPKPSIDTGMGLERITAILSGVTVNYDSPLFTSVFEGLSQISTMDYARSKDEIRKVSARVVADHIRAMTFLIADGVRPSKDGRGYVLRRIMRRAMRHGRNIELASHGLATLSASVVSAYGHHYTELESQKDLIANEIAQEEDRFEATVDRGLSLLFEKIDQLEKEKQQTLPGEIAFQLYDTYGFPLDLTADVLREKNLFVDQKGFDQAFQNHKEKARGSWKGAKGKELESLVTKWVGQGFTNEFVGYEKTEHTSTIEYLVVQDQETDQAKEHQDLAIVAKQTPFYGESGGQVGDMGTIMGEGFEIDILDTQKIMGDTIVHIGRVVQGEVKKGAKALFKVNEQSRSATAKNHTATHLLHSALKKVLGDHVQQKGSMVGPERLRFDFSHGQGVDPRQIFEIEQLVNQQIWENNTVEKQVLPLSKAMESGAIGMFGEKYGEEVRVVTMGDFSKELCGGTHLNRTGEIGLFKIIKESSVSQGVRRIEAFTSLRAFQYFDDLYKTQLSLSESLGIAQEGLVERVEKMLQQQKELKKKIASNQSQTSVDLSNVETIGGISVLMQTIDIDDPKTLRSIADRALEKIQKGVAIIGAKDQEKAFLVVKVSKDLSTTLHAGNLVKLGASILEGSGGGRPDFAQAGGTKKENIAQALDAIRKNLTETLG